MSESIFGLEWHDEALVIEILIIVREEEYLYI